MVNVISDAKKIDYLVLIVLIFSTVVLFLNDWVWKYEYSNWITGKLSDFAGLLALPIFLSILFPPMKKKMAPIIGFGFICWKHPIADDLINFWNSVSLFKVARVIDFTDLWALLVLIFAHFLINKCDLNRLREDLIRSTNLLIRTLTILSFLFVFCATSLQEPMYPKGDILIEKSYHIEGITEAEVIDHFRTIGLDVSRDSIVFYSDRVEYRNIKYKRPCYQIAQFVFSKHNRLDTLSDINFDVRPAQGGVNIHVINCSVQDDWDLQNWETLKARQEIYTKVISENLIKGIGH